MRLKFLYIFLFFLSIAAQANTRNPSQLTSKLEANSPIGDNIHVSIYDFILEELMKHQDISKEKLQAIKKQEKESLSHPESIKPYVADVAETQFSHILTTLCKGNRWMLRFRSLSKRWASRWLDRPSL